MIALVISMFLSSVPDAPPPPSPAPLQRVAFGSCARENMPQPIWAPIIAEQPDLFLFIGDNIYADTGSERTMREKYGQLAAQEGYAQLREACPVLATWDDHDYGRNDAGKEYPFKEMSQRLFLDFFKVPADSPRRTHPGIYGDEVFGPPGKRVQIILLDTRYFRDALQTLPKARRTGGVGPYLPWEETGHTLLGEAQWAWLASALRKPAELRIIASSIQVVSSEHGWESWGNFPRERDRLFRLIGDTGAGGVLFISGDRHLAELSCDRSSVSAPYPMYDVTSSGLTNYGGGNATEPNAHRMGSIYQMINYGMLRIDWDAPGVAIQLQVVNRSGTPVIEHTVTLDELKKP